MSTPARAKSLFVCSACGAESARWLGQCPGCNEWNTLLEQAAVAKRSHRAGSLVESAPLERLSDIQALETVRYDSGIEEFNRVLGGGIVPGQVVLIGGDPGIGKSTLLLQSPCRRPSFSLLTSHLQSLPVGAGCCGMSSPPRTSSQSMALHASRHSRTRRPRCSASSCSTSQPGCWASPFASTAA